MRKRCGWLRRWWHRRLRRIDREMIEPALDGDLRTLVLFRNSQGQEHWRCPCAREEVRP